MTEDYKPKQVSLALIAEHTNTIRTPLLPVACWRLGDGLFRFDHKVISPEAKDEFAGFWRIRDEHPQAPIALFGHADVTGNDAYNHTLAAERAQAVYAVLNGDPDMWFDLFANDQESLERLKSILVDYGLDESEVGYGASTTEAARLYMADLGGGRKLEPFDYLDDGERAMQSCSEFNPVLRASQDLIARLKSGQRAKLESVNRRVVAYFFEPGTNVGGSWPCPVAGAGVGKCKKRFWSDSDKRRRTPKKDSKQYWPKGFGGRPKSPLKASSETFACRFYERLTQARECERVSPRVPPPEKPDPPPKPPPPEKPTPEKPTPAKPVGWDIVLECNHVNVAGVHLHRNRLMCRSLARRGKDLLQVVPDGKTDTITASTTDKTKVKWTVGGKVIPGLRNQITVDASQWEMANAMPWDLLKVSPREILVKADETGRVRECLIQVYPSSRYMFDFEDIRRPTMAVWDPMLAIINFAGECIADDFNVSVLKKEDCAGKFACRWREWPRPTGGGEDYRSALDFLFRVKAEPLMRGSGALTLSLATVIKRVKILRKSGKLKRLEKLDKILDKIDEHVIKRLEGVKLEGSFAAKGGGRLLAERKGPDPKELPTIGRDAKSNPLELNGSYRGMWIGEADPGSIIAKKFSDFISVGIGLSLSFDCTLGFIADIRTKKLGAYVVLDFHGLDVALRASAGASAKTVVTKGVGATKLDSGDIALEWPKSR